MSKNVYQEYDVDALKHFKLDGELNTGTYGVCISHTTYEIADVISTDSENLYNRIRDILNLETTDKIDPSWKRAFLLPNCPVSLDRVKAAAKEHKITITQDIEAADFFISHGKISNYCSSGQAISSRYLMTKLWNYETFKDASHGSLSMKKYIERTDCPIIYDGKCETRFKIWKCDTYDTLYDSFIIGGLAVNTAFKIVSDGLNVMDVDTLLSLSANVQVLDEQLVSDLIKQIDSYNTEDNEIAGKILPTVQYDDNYHLLWKLAHGIHGSLYKFNRNKDVQFWIKKSNINDFAYKNAQEMILWLEEAEVLNKENFKYLEPICRKEISIHNRELYVFKVQVRPEYREFLKPN